MVNLLRRIYLDADSDEDLFTGSAQIFRRRCDYLLQMLDVKHCPGVTPRGLRGGGAVAFYRKGGSVSELLWAMRLKQIATLESYLQEVAALSFCRSSPRTALLLYVLPLPFFLISTAEGFLQRFALCAVPHPRAFFGCRRVLLAFVTAFEATLDALEPYALQKVFAGWLFGICRCCLVVAMQSSAALAHFLHGAVVHAKRDPSQFAAAAGS